MGPNDVMRTEGRLLCLELLTGRVETQPLVLRLLAADLDPLIAPAERFQEIEGGGYEAFTIPPSAWRLDFGRAEARHIFRFDGSKVLHVYGFFLTHGERVVHCTQFRSPQLVTDDKHQLEVQTWLETSL